MLGLILGEDSEDSPDITSISITPESVEITVGEYEQFTLMAQFSDGSNENKTGMADWSSSNDSIASMGAPGYFTGIAYGDPVTITANYEGFTASSTLTVNSSYPENSFLLTLNVPSASDGTETVLSGLFNNAGDLVGMLSNYTTFSGGTLSSLLFTVRWGEFYTPGTSIAAFTPGTYSLYLIIDMDGDGFDDINDINDIGVFREVLIDGATELTLEASDFELLVEEPIIVTGSSLTTGSEILIGHWLVPETGMIENPVAVSQYMLSDGSEGSIPPSGWRAMDSNVSSFNESGAVTTDFNTLLIPGVYDLSIAIDADANSYIGPGDYLFYMENITIDGSGTDITDALTVAEPIPEPAPTAMVPSPSDVSLALGEMIEMGNNNGTVSYDNGNTETFYNLRDQFTWVSGDETVATVNSTGQIWAVGLGSTVVTVSFGDVSAEIPVTVTEAELLYITIDPSPVEIILAGVTPWQQLIAMGTYTDSTEVDISTDVAWSSGDTGIVTVGISTGLATAQTTGSASITAGLDGKTASVGITVVQFELITINVTPEGHIVTPADYTIFIGEEVQYTATGAYNDGTEEDLTDAVTWSKYGGFGEDLLVGATGLVTGRIGSTSNILYVRALYDPGTGTVEGLSEVEVDPWYLYPGTKWTTGANPAGMDIDSNGYIYVTIQSNSSNALHKVMKYGSDGAWDANIGSGGYGAEQFVYPTDVAVDSSGNIFVVDRGMNRIQKYDSAGVHLLQIGSSGDLDGQFTAPSGVAVDGAGNVYVSDDSTDRIQKFDSDGVFITKWGSSGTGPGQFSSPQSIAVDSAGNIYVVEYGNKRIQKFTTEGGHLLTFGNSGFEDGVLAGPKDIAIDTAGNIFVTDQIKVSEPNSVVVFYSDGTYFTRWGHKLDSFYGNIGTFVGSQGIAVNAFSGSVFVSDIATDYSRIQEFIKDTH